LSEDGKPRRFDIFEGPATQHRIPIELVLVFHTNAARHGNADRDVNDFWNPSRIYSFAGNWNELGIPAKLNSIPEGSRTPFRPEGEHRRSEATLAF